MGPALPSEPAGAVPLRFLQAIDANARDNPIVHAASAVSFVISYFES